MAIIAKILLFLEIIILAAAVGAIVIFFGSIFVSELLGASNINGGLAMGAAGLAPLGAAIGALLGAWLSILTIKRLRDKTVKKIAFGVFAIVILFVAGWFIFQELTDPDPYSPQEEPTVLIEWRLPQDTHNGVGIRSFRFEMRSSYMDWPLDIKWDDPPMRMMDKSTILRLRAKIRWRVNNRVFQLWGATSHEKRISEILNLPRDPKPTPQYSEWRKSKSAPGHQYRTRVTIK